MRVVLPQVVKKIIPPLGNEVITLVKDTALVQVLGVAELFHVAQTQSGRLVSVMPLFIAGLFYFIMNWAVSKSFDFLYRKQRRCPWNNWSKRERKVHASTDGMPA